MTNRIVPVSDRNLGGPLDARVKIHRVELSRGTVFQVVAVWHDRGLPPEPGQPDHRGYHADHYDADQLTLARALAGTASEQLRAGREPDLRVIAADLKRRDHGLVSVGRVDNGQAVPVLGDTAPDENPAR